MTRPLVRDPDNIRLAMLGMVDGNGHPYSWSAILNGGFRAEVMNRSPYPAIPKYLAGQPSAALGIPGARVTHIWCERRAEAEHVAAASLIPHVVDHPLDAIGRVDAVVIPTDRPEEHVDRARPFIEAGVPIFIDKPLTDRPEHLSQFRAWHEQGKAFFSTSCMRYAQEYRFAPDTLAAVGTLRLITMTMCKSWERYGIHALEGICPLLRPGRWLSVGHNGDERANIVHLRHADGVEVVITQIADLQGAFGCLGVFGTRGHVTATFTDTFAAFKAQLVDMVQWLRTGELPVPFDHTVELMNLLIAAIRSRNEGGRLVLAKEFQ